MYTGSGKKSIGEDENHFKKKRLVYAERSEEKRIEYLEKLAEIPQEERVYVDESGCDEYYHRKRGRALRGVKVEGVCRGRQYARTNVIAAKCNGEIWSPRTYNHTTTGRFFVDVFEHDLLSIVPQGYTIIMDNASFHPKKELRKIADRYGVKLLFLPPYSPDFNPIENLWANLKHWLRDHLPIFVSLRFAILHYSTRFIS